ncbi:hypothetical protein [Pseudarthrobacter sp. NamE2]|uniref:hypothetical protein n=1 Tax=Pseudarthrobacter sp. NamE2 TaxID=2576838 RepID=UPI001F0F37D3|nr:hypothetical protein [Pseudarthrobacter sp. NamE2]
MRPGSASGLDAVERLTPQVDALLGYLGGHADKAQALMGRKPVVGLDYPDIRSAGSIAFDYPPRSPARPPAPSLHGSDEDRVP